MPSRYNINLSLILCDNTLRCLVIEYESQILYYLTWLHMELLLTFKCEIKNGLDQTVIVGIVYKCSVGWMLIVHISSSYW